MTYIHITIKYGLKHLPEKREKKEYEFVMPQKI